MSMANPRLLLADARTEPTLRDLIAPLFRRRTLLLATFGAVFLCGLLAALVMGTTYESRMEVLVNHDRLDPMVSTETTVQQPQLRQPVTEEETNSEVELLHSRDLLEKVAVANGLHEPRRDWLSRLFPTPDEATRIFSAAKKLGKKITVKALPKTNLIEVTYRSTEPQIAFGVLNSLAGFYTEKHVSVHRPTGSYDFFAAEAEKYKKALADSEAQLASFGNHEGVVAPDQERGMLDQKLVDSVAVLHETRQAMAADEEKIRNERSQLKITPARSSTAQASNSADALLQQLQSSLLAAQLKRTQLAVKYDASYPLVQEADQEIKQTQDAIAEAQRTRYVNQMTDRDPTYEFLRQDTAKTEADLAFQKAKASALENSIATIRKTTLELQEKALRQAELVRETKANETNYLLYLSKREQERTSDALDRKRIANVAIAVPPAIPALPVHSPIVIVAMAFVLASVASLAAAYLVDFVDPAFRTPTEVGEILQIPVVVGIPRLQP